MIGTVLGNRYEIIEKIGGGGMALVYKAKCRLLNRYVAIKILRDEFINDEEFIKKFKRESQAAASLSHPNIVNIYDVGVDEKDEHNIHYIVMEYIKGKTLKEVIREKGKLTVGETIDYSIQIAEALEHAHKNHIVHRDIKPHNIMITEDNRVKVTDFGIARAASSSTVTNTSNVIGSVHYFSPEQARGGYTDEKSDIYSLGIVMYEMITGQVPYEGDSPISVALKHIQEDIIPPMEIDSGVPINLQKIIMKCVKKSQSDRYNTANELLRDLKRIKYDSVGKELEDTSIIESPTQIIPAVEGEDIDNMKKSKQKKGKNRVKNKKNDGGLKVVLLAILLAFIVTGSITFGFFRLKDLFISTEIPVPDLLGMNEDVAEAKLKDLGLGFKVEKRVPNDEFDEGDIIYQRIPAGQKVKKGYTIEVNVSEGKSLVKVPNLINRNIMELDAILSEYGLSEGDVDYQPSDTIEANIIINQSPEPYSEIEAGSAVNIIVSQGPDKKFVTMPKLVGLPEQEANNAIVANQLVRGQRREEPSDEYAKGVVIWQSIEPGTELEANTSIDIYISSGPAEKPEEPDNDKDKDKEIPFKIDLVLPDDEGEVEIKVDRVQDGVKENVYDKSHKKNGKTIKIPLKGKTDAKFEFYFDGEYQDTIEHPDR